MDLNNILISVIQMQYIHVENKVIVYVWVRMHVKTKDNKRRGKKWWEILKH